MKLDIVNGQGAIPYGPTKQLSDNSIKELKETSNTLDSSILLNKQDEILKLLSEIEKHIQKLNMQIKENKTENVSTQQLLETSLSDHLVKLNKIHNYIKYAARRYFKSTRELDAELQEIENKFDLIEKKLNFADIEDLLTKQLNLIQEWISEIEDKIKIHSQEINSGIEDLYQQLLVQNNHTELMFSKFENDFDALKYAIENHKENSVIDIVFAFLLGAVGGIIGSIITILFS